MESRALTMLCDARGGCGRVYIGAAFFEPKGDARTLALVSGESYTVALTAGGLASLSQVVPRTP